MAVNAVTMASLTGLFKQVYAEGIVGLIPDVADLVKNIKFGEAERVGDYYHQPVILTRETGITYAASGAGAYALAPSVPMVMKDAQIAGVQTTLRSQIALDVLARSVGSSAAFKKATLPIIEANLESHTKRLELGLLYGQSATGIGQVLVTGGTAVDSTHYTLEFDVATWAVGIWGGEEGSKVIFYRNDNAALVSSAADAIFVVQSIDTDTRKITFTGTSTGVTALTSAVGAAALNTYFYGTTGLSASDGGAGIAATWSTANSVEMAGIDRIITNTGTLFGISAATYTLWKGNTYNAAGQLSMGKLIAGINKAVGKGGLKERVTAYVSTDTWPNLMTDQSALRKYDGSFKSGEAVNGFESIKFFGANGEIEIKHHSCVKSGESIVVPLKRFARVGSTEITFQNPGRGDEIFLNLPDNNGFELRSYADQAVLCRTPAKTLKITGIVNR
jgi:hypothetical protein